jgi:pimeloyl-ACP methyl ester carboxylesterase
VLRLATAAPVTKPLGVPTLLIWGENDIYLSPTLASGLGPYVTDLTVHRLPGASHWVQQDFPAQVDRLIAEWALRERLAAPADSATTAKR